MKKIAKKLITLITVVAAVSLLLVNLQSDLIDVSASVVPLIVYEDHLDFGTVFPGEERQKNFTVHYVDDGTGNDVPYWIIQKIKPLVDAEVPVDYDGSISDYCQEFPDDQTRCYRNLCPYLTKVSEEGEGDIESSASIGPNDQSDLWIIYFEVPAIIGHVSQDHTGGIIDESGTYGCDISVNLELEPPVCDPDVELAINGGFETPVVTHNSKWDIYDSSQTPGWGIEWNASAPGQPVDAYIELHRGVNNWTPAVGEQYSELDSDWDGPDGVINGEAASIRIYQDLDTIIGETYQITFDFSPRPGMGLADNDLEFSWNGTVQDTISADGTGLTDTNWSNHNYSFTAVNAVTRLQFADIGEPNSLGTFLDNVSVRCIPPEETYCGDGIVQDPNDQGFSEECEQDSDCPVGAAYTCEGCVCEAEPHCGDGNLDPGEECDDGNNVDGDGCTANCFIEEDTYCGDGAIQNPNDDGIYEECEYDVDCEQTYGPDYTCEECYCQPPDEPVCGDSTLDPGEECEAGFEYMCTGDTTCNSQTCLCDPIEEPYCGDGIVDAGEECEQDSDCPPTAAYTCDQCVCLPPSEPECGNYIIEAGEECEEAFEYYCTEGTICNIQTCLCDPVGGPDNYCGDDIIQDPNDDGLSEQCEATEDCEEGYTCTDCICEPIQTGPYCGDDIVNGDEQCEDSADCEEFGEGYTCDECECKKSVYGGPECGNQLLELGEECEENSDCEEGYTCNSCICTSTTNGGGGGGGGGGSYSPRLLLEKSVDHEFVNPGSTVTYTLEVTNIGNQTGENLTFDDTLPAGFTYTDTGLTTHHWDLGDIAASESIAIKYDVDIGSDVTAGEYINVAVARITNGGYPDNEATADENLEVRTAGVLGESASPAPTIEKDITEEFANPGSVLNYTITVLNSGDLPLYDAVVTDTLPAGFTFVETGLSEHTFTIGEISPGQLVTLEYQVIVSDTAAAGVYLNTAVLTSSNYDPLTTTANTEVRVPEVLGEISIPETGIKFIHLILLVLLGIISLASGIFIISKKSLKI